MSLFSQIVVSASDHESAPLAVWDLHTGTQLAAFKGNASGPNSICTLGNDYLLASQSAKDALHFWTWHKEAVLLRSFVAEKVPAIGSSPSGAYVAGGGVSGNLYLWSTSTGRLLLCYKAHHKGIQCVQFTDGGSMLVTAGDDAIVNVWSLVELLDASSPQQHFHAPRWSWSQHTLPITSLSVGSGEANPHVISASLDQTCRVWSTASGCCVQTILLPAALHCVALHWTEHFIFAGAANGKIYHASLAFSSSEALDGGTAAPAAVPATVTQHSTLHGHKQAVTCLALATDGRLLVSGSRDGSVRVWDTATRQLLQMLQPPCHAAVTGLLVRTRPPYLHVSGARSHKGDGSSQALAKPVRPLPLAHFAKFPGSSTTTKPWEDGVIVLDGAQAYGDILASSGLLAFCERAAALGDASAQKAGDARVAELEQELAEWKRRCSELSAHKHSGA